jgi:16S rRNA (cytosine1402-N4)-methyltransferase
VHHQPVLLEESLHWLGARPGSWVVDGTLGDGGHAEAILERTAPDGRLVGLDRDLDALRIAGERLARFGARVSLAHASFRELRAVLESAGAPRVDGVLLDLGVSSRQLDQPERGFRFGTETARATALDMRMDASAGETAAELLARASEDELATCFREYGELPGAGRLARTIASRRAAQPLRTTADLLAAIRDARIGGGRKHNPATLVFQALRIAVNDELGALDAGLGAAIDALAPGGRVCVIAYHSLEDRIVKQRFAREERPCTCAPSAPVCTCGSKPRLARATRRAVVPEEAEIHNNPRARSAKLRAAEKLPEAA